MNKLIGVRLAVLFVMLSVSVSWAQLNGRVFVDTNNNGKMDAGEHGAVDCVVSDGLHIVKTDKKGNFNLPGWDKQRFVTLYPSADFNCAQSFYPIVESQKEYGFAITPKERKKEVRFVQISDTETYEYRDWADQLKQYAQVHQPDFIIHTGDICYQSGMAWHAENITTQKFGVPVYYCLGNHDLIKGDYGEQFFEACFGPAWYAFEEANTLFVVTPMMGGDYKPSFNREDIGTWLENLLKAYPAEQPKIFFNHDLLTNGEAFDFKINEEEVISLNESNLKAWLYGHWHNNMAKEHGSSGIMSYGTSTLAAGGIDHSPSGFRVVDVDEQGNTSSHFKWTNLNREIKIVSPQKNVAIQNAAGEIQLAVNVYHTGSAVDSVHYALYGDEGLNWNSALDQSKWQKMVQQSDWTWGTTLKPEESESYTLVVNAFLHSGEILNAKHSFSAEQPKKTNVNGEWFNLAGNPAHHAVVDEEHEMPYQLQWTSNVGSNIFMSSPVLYENMLVTASFDDGDAQNCSLVGMDATTGVERWRYQTQNSVKNQLVVAQGIAIAVDMLGVTYAVDVLTGKLRWKRDLNHNRLPGIVNGIVTDGQLVYSGFGKALCALDVESGDELWRNKAWGGGNGTTPIMTIADDVLIASSQWGAIYAHNRHTGELLWKRGDAGLRFRDGVLSYEEGALWVTGKGSEKAVPGILHQLELKTGKTIQTYETGMQQTGTSAPIILKDRFIVAGSHPGITAVSRETGEQLWRFEVEPALLYTPSYYADRQQSIESTPLLIGDKLVFGAMDGRVYALDAISGKLLWRTELGAPVVTSVAVDGKRFYICDFAGNVYCFQAN
ncbi:PQQ-binding-like beta-propeller repeat protein [Sunxiuqinia elliptica]|uniref:Outer membrane protein assembly factor BamB n=1 Tax=Sunxiuqinia elliptica TaxID=655355 RepID=A0A4R6GNE7_9BACT|nr:PQQ-binding-like beta-propeller repeat protein [Sunxiuqinia elliptica]TDN95885.1 outer membrane protein assembly factor BamB [Sunxiuqinia elliptica]TDO67826.1 outer membrane protein assembly factor BamB [Sunxiuqinia elliptica]